MKVLPFLVTALTCALVGCARERQTSGPPTTASQVTLQEISEQETIAAAEAFAESRKFPTSKHTLDTMRRQGEQVPPSALGAEGRLRLAIFLDKPTKTAIVDFYHDKSGHVVSTIVHLEPFNKP